jgi:hypothetical protein
MLLLAQPPKTTAVMPFIKFDAVGFNPNNPDERILFTKGCAESMTREFKKLPLLLVSQRQSHDGKKIEVEYRNIGAVSCVFLGADQWMLASIESEVPIPKNHVLRARTSSASDRTEKGVVVVEKGKILEFHLKEEKSSTIFR